MRQVAEDEGRIDEGRRLGEGGHVRRRDDGVVHRPALRHVLEILLFQAEAAVLVQHEIDRLAVVLLDQLLELDHRLGIGMVVAELGGAVQGDDALGAHRDGQEGGRGQRAAQQGPAVHGVSSDVAGRLGRRRCAGD